jgi:hypothetical protein
MICLGAVDASAQGGGGAGGGGGGAGGGGGGRGRGNFDPAQARERRLAQIREQLEVTSDDDWKVIGDLAGKVIDAERDASNRGGAFGGGRRPRNNGAADAQQGTNQPPRRRGPANPETDALQKLVDDKAASDEIKAGLAKVRESRKEKQAKLEKAREDLQKVLSVRQEAQAVLAGLLN